MAIVLTRHVPSGSDDMLEHSGSTMLNVADGKIAYSMQVWLRGVIVVGSCFLVCLSPAIVSAGAFRIFDQSASATAQGGAFAAQADDPSAIYFNPAGLTQLSGVQTS